MSTRKANGFTVVELLVVLVIIALLAGIVVTAAGADPTATNGKYTFRVKYCSAPALATGFEIGYYDYTASNIATITGGGNTTACTTYGTNATP